MLEGLLREVEEVAPVLSANADEAERLGRLTPAAIEALARTRLLRMSTPQELGGDQADPAATIAVLEALARIDASAAWVAGIIQGTTASAGGMLPKSSTQRIFADGFPLIAGALSPIGNATPVEGGYRLSGRWPFGSGIHHASWVAAGARVQGASAGPARLLVLLVPRAVVTVHDNWQVAGLKASGSCDYSMADVFVPEDHTWDFFGSPHTGYRLAGVAGVTPFHIGIALGIARRALDEISAQALAKARGIPPSTLVTQPHVQSGLGRAELELAAARSLAFGVIERLWDEAKAGVVASPAQQCEARAASAYVTGVAERVTRFAFQAAGGGALFDTNPLQRCMRDILAAGQHFVVSETSFRAYGQFLLGQTDANPMG